MELPPFLRISALKYLTRLSVVIFLFGSFMSGSTYGMMVVTYQFIDKTPFEKLHLKFLKQILGVKTNTSNIAIRMETGQQPLESLTKIQLGGKNRMVTQTQNLELQTPLTHYHTLIHFSHSFNQSKTIFLCRFPLLLLLIPTSYQGRP